MNGEFVDTNVLLYAHDASAGRKRARAVTLLERLSTERRGLLSSHRIHFWDGMIVRAAAALGSEVIWTEDLNAGQSYEGIGVRNPFT